MPERPSYWTRILALGLAAGLVVAGAGDVAAQDDLEAVCAALSSPGECYLAAGAARVIQPRIGVALWGGSPVPGTASTVGLRLRAKPRVSLSGRVLVVPTTLPPLLDRTRTESSTAWITGATVQGTVGLFHGYSPLATAGGVLSLDLLARVSHARVPAGKGFDRSAVWGFATGVRLGVLRESLTLPGLSATALYGRSSVVGFGDFAGDTGNGAMKGAVSGLQLSAAASRRLFGLRLGAGVSYDRYASDVHIRYTVPALGAQATGRGDAVTERWAWYGSLTWSRIIYHLVVEAGRQQAPRPGGLPAGVDVNPAGWWASVAFRLTP